MLPDNLIKNSALTILIPKQVLNPLSNFLGKLHLHVLILIICCFFSNSQAIGESNGTLWILAVSNNNTFDIEYQPYSSPIRFSTDEKDVRDISEAFSNKIGSYYSQVVKLILLGNSATLESIHISMRAIEENSRPGDGIIIFFSGLAISKENGGYQILTKDSSPHNISNTSIDDDQLYNFVSRTKANTLLLLNINALKHTYKTEKCNSSIEKYQNDPFIFNKSASKAILITCSNPFRIDLLNDTADSQNGYFARSVIEALGKESLGKDVSPFRISDVISYISRRLPSLTENTQNLTVKWNKDWNLLSK